MNKKLRKFTFSNDSFLLDGKKIQIISGEMHYQRIPEAYWENRIKMVKAMGLNSIAIYMFWNAHEPEPGEFSFNGRNNVRKFVQLVQDNGLFIILRPGPYCCAEWDFGGFPPWLLKDDSLEVRCMYKPYLDAVERYVKRWSQELLDLQCTKGGPILMVQVENEYGSFGRDHKYIRWIKNLLEDVGFEVPLFTCDGGSEYYFVGGSIPELLPSANFGSDPEKNFGNLNRFRKDIPHFCAEYYPGWFNHWGDHRFFKLLAPIRQKKIKELDWMLTNEKSWNLYMVHGGTNFGFCAGANQSKKYSPTITSYDYGSPIGESGQLAPMYNMIRELIKEKKLYNKDRVTLENNKKNISLTSTLSNNQSFIDIPEKPVHGKIPTIEFTEISFLLDEKNLPDPIYDPIPHPMEHYGLYYGFILYRTQIPNVYSGKKLYLSGVHDYALILIDGIRIETIDRSELKVDEKVIIIPKFEKDEVLLDIFVEPMGRVNYGPYIINRKGITGIVQINYQIRLMKWDIFLFSDYNSLIEERDLKNIHIKDILNNLSFNPIKSMDLLAEGSIHNKGPIVWKSIVNLSKDQIVDTYLDCRCWRKGMIWVNGHNLGRFWEKGPQYSLYLPGAWLKEGKNEFILLDLNGPVKKSRLKRIFKKKNYRVKSNERKEIIVPVPIFSEEKPVRDN